MICILTTDAIQVDVLSPLLYNFYRSDLITELNKCNNCGINIKNVNISSLCYVDDHVLLS